MANGSYAEHLELEAELAAFYDMPYGMVFSTGYSANLGTLVALLGPGDARGYYPGYSADALASKRRFSWLVLKGHTENDDGLIRKRRKIIMTTRIAPNMSIR